MIIGPLSVAVRPCDCPRPGFPEGATKRHRPPPPRPLSRRLTPDARPLAAPVRHCSDEEVLAHGRREMSYMRGDLLTKTRKLVKGLAKPAPTWLKAMEE